MAQWTIPLDSIQAWDTVDVSLSGVEYRLEFLWNDRNGSNNPAAGGSWTLSLLDTNDNYLIAGMRILAGSELLATYATSTPPGRLYVIDQSGQDLDPGFDDLGSRIILVYDDLVAS